MILKKKPWLLHWSDAMAITAPLFSLWFISLCKFLRQLHWWEVSWPNRIRCCWKRCQADTRATSHKKCNADTQGIHQWRSIGHSYIVSIAASSFSSSSFNAISSSNFPSRSRTSISASWQNHSSCILPISELRKPGNRTGSCQWSSIDHVPARRVAK